MTGTNTFTTIGEIVAADFRTAAVFQRHQIDFCCQGARTLERGCREAGVGLRPFHVEDAPEFVDLTSGSQHSLAGGDRLTDQGQRLVAAAVLVDPDVDRGGRAHGSTRGAVWR